MMEHHLSPGPGATRRRKRVGRGNGSGSGTYAGRGMKGQKSRSGGGVRPGFEGGQLPLIKGLPMKRGFTNIFKKQYHLIKLETLHNLPEDSEVTPEILVELGYVRSLKHQIKILGNGEIGIPLKVTAHKFTKAAREKIEAAGGTVEVL